MTLLALVVTADLSLDHCTPNGSLNISGTDTWQKSLGVEALCTSPLDVTVYCQLQSNSAAAAGETGHFCRWWQEYVTKLAICMVGVAWQLCQVLSAEEICPLGLKGTAVWESSWGRDRIILSCVSQRHGFWSCCDAFHTAPVRHWSERLWYRAWLPIAQ